MIFCGCFYGICEFLFICYFVVDCVVSLFGLWVGENSNSECFLEELEDQFGVFACCDTDANNFLLFSHILIMIRFLLYLTSLIQQSLNLLKPNALSIHKHNQMRHQIPTFLNLPLSILRKTKLLRLLHNLHNSQFRIILYFMSINTTTTSLSFCNM